MVAIKRQQKQAHRSWCSDKQDLSYIKKEKGSRCRSTHNKPLKASLTFQYDVTDHTGTRVRPCFMDAEAVKWTVVWRRSWSARLLSVCVQRLPLFEKKNKNLILWKVKAPLFLSVRNLLPEKCCNWLMFVKCIVVVIIMYSFNATLLWMKMRKCS